MTHFLWIGRGCVLLARDFLAGGRLNLRQQRFPLPGYSGIRQSSVSLYWSFTGTGWAKIRLCNALTLHCPAN